MNPKLWILEYFQSVINQVDITAESFLLKNNSDQFINANIIDEKRSDIINKIKEIEQFNLECLKQNDNLIKSILLNGISDHHELQKVLKIIFVKFCVFVSREKRVKGKITDDFGVLLILDSYVPCEQIQKFNKFNENLKKKPHKRDEWHLDLVNLV